MTYNISIGSFRINKLLSCEIRKDANKLSDTATIKIPGMAYGAALEIESKINRGDKVTILLGYDDNLNLEFEGYVSIIATDNTITIECEDSLYLTKKEVKNKVFKKVTVMTVLKDVISQLPGLSIEFGDGIPDLRYDKFTISEATGWDVLKKIQDEYNIHIFAKGSVIHVFLKFTYKSGSVKYHFEKNVEKASLKYMQEEDRKVLVEVVGIDKDNKKTKVQVGEPGGDKFTEHRYNISNKNTLIAIGEEAIKKYRYTGYSGDITTWLFPFCTYGYSAEINDPDYVERQGIYYVEASVVQFNQSGGSRKNSLSIKVA